MAKIKILIVDDNPFICQLLESRLQANGYDTVIATSGTEAFQKAKDYLPNLILLDISMPGEDGFEAGSKIKNYQQTSKIPIIMVTAQNSQGNIMRAVSELNAAAYIIKPFKPEDLIREIQKVLDKYNWPDQ